MQEWLLGELLCWMGLLTLLCGQLRPLSGSGKFVVFVPRQGSATGWILPLGMAVGWAEHLFLVWQGPRLC